jgi:hypothetical protein
LTVRLADVLVALGAEDSLEVLQPFWDDAGVAAVPGGIPAFLSPGDITANREYVGLPADVDELLLETARRVRGNPALLALAVHCHRLLFEHLEYPQEGVGTWPSLERVLPRELAGVFYLLVALGVVPLGRAAHRRKGIPEAVTRDTLNDLTELVWFYRRKNDGRWGILLRVAGWLRLHVAADVFRLGRFEYILAPFEAKARAFRHRRDGTVLALADDGVWFDPGGHAWAGEASGDRERGWTSELALDERTVTGFPMSPYGVAVREKVELPLSEWECVLASGDLVLDTHIPAGEGMPPDRCADSMRQALAFFPRHFPAKPCVGFTCASWLLNPDLAEFHSPTSNMVQWQRELYLLPCPSDGHCGAFHVFGEDRVDPATAPRNTSLLRAMVAQVEAGKPLRAGAMFMLSEDFRHFGTQYYRRTWPPRVLAASRA